MITVFDSGIGGLEILRQIHARLPHAPLLYFGDTAYMPYGKRSAEEILARVTWFINEYKDRTDLFVIACNSATVSLIGEYRKLANVPFVGIEPGVKPAVAASPSGNVAVLATPRTAGSDQLARLISDHAGSAVVTPIACDGLAEAIERQPEQVDDRVAACLAKLPAAVDTVVLACTHYSLIQPTFQKFLGKKTLIDVSGAVADQVARLYYSLPHQTESAAAEITFGCSGDRAAFMARVTTFVPELVRE
jgi:glutamate racemase